MISLVRVDDRLLHGQIICSWVPYIKADALIVASDNAAGDELTNQIMQACSCDELSVNVMKVDEAARFAKSNACTGSMRVILVVGEIKDAVRLYDGGVRFASLNLGNVHHVEGGRAVAASVILNREDEDCIGRLESLGVTIEVRDIPGREPSRYKHEDGCCK